MAKLSHRRVKFEHPGMGKDQCQRCQHWLGPMPDQDSCAIVRAPVRRADWCNRFVRRTLGRLRVV